MARRDPNFPMQGKRGGMGGTYGSKSTNLSKKTLKAAGAAKAAGKRTVSVSQTRREGSRTLGPGGKPLTGTVTLLDGSKAVYKNGRRVQAADARKPKPASRAAAPSRPAAPARPDATSGGSQRQRPAMSAAERAKMGKGRKNWQDGARRTPSASGTANAAPSRSSTPSMSGRASAGPRDTRTPAEKAYDAARASLAEWQKKKLVTAADIAKEKQKRRMVQEALARVKAQGKVR